MIEQATVRRLTILCLALLAANLAARWLLAGSLPLTDMEAYHWEWSRFPTTGYVDEPPLIAWLIGGTTALLGSTGELAVRLGPVVLGTASYLLVYRLALQLFGDREVAWRAVLVSLCLPLLAVVGMTGLPESPLFFFHLLGLSLLCQAIQGGRPTVWLASGAVFGLALLSKLIGLLLVAAVVGFLLTGPAERRRMSQRGAGLFLAAAALVFSPYLIWNLEHDWAGFRVQWWDRHIARFDFGIDDLLEFFVEQVVNAPFLMLPLAACLFVRARDLPAAWAEPIRLLRWQAGVPLLVYIVLGAFSETHPQRTISCFVMASIMMAAVWTVRRDRLAIRRPMVWVGVSQVAMFAVAGGLIFAFPWAARIDPASLPASFKVGLTKARHYMLGMDRLAEELERRFVAAGIPLDRIGADDGGVPVRLFGPDHHVSSPLAHAWRHGPVIHVPAMLNRPPGVGDAQAFFLPPGSYIGGRGLLLARERDVERLTGAFASATELPPVEQRHDGQSIERFRLFAVEGFLAGPSN